jgi:ribosomal protein S18 acetylase RimI-like enzyme
MKYQIRLAEDKDHKPLIQLMKVHADFEGLQLKVTPKHNHLTDLDSLPITLFLVESDNQPLGYMSVIKQFSTWDMDWYLYLDCLYLTEEARGLGIGKQLMQQLAVYAQKQKINTIQWQTPTSNLPAIAFYKKLGAVNKEKHRFFWEIPKLS